MQTATDDFVSLGEERTGLQFDPQPAPPTYSTPQPRLGTASPRNQQLTSERSPVIMSTNSQPYNQPSPCVSADVEDTKEEQTPQRDQHRRGYQACDPCRKRKVKCDLGSVLAWRENTSDANCLIGVDNPHDPPCMRCRREHKECLFSATRRKRKQSQDGDDASSDGGLGKDKRRLTETANDLQGEGLAYSYPYSSPSPYPQSANLGAQWPSHLTATRHTSQPRSSNGYDLSMTMESKPFVSGRSSQTLSPGPLAPVTSPRTNPRNASEHMLNKEAASILHPSIATSHEALHLLSVAAGQTEEANRQSSQSLPSHLCSPSTTFGTPSSTSASHRRNLSHNMVASERPSGEQISGEAGRFGIASDQTFDSAESQSYQEALQMWSRMRLVKDGWFTATEAMAYVD